MKLWYCQILFHSTVVRAERGDEAEEIAREKADEYGWGEESCSVRELPIDGPPREVLVEIVE